MTDEVARALGTIPDARSRVDASDDYLREVIRGVESAFGRLCPAPVDLAFEIDGKPRCISLCQSARDSHWYITWQEEPASEVALLSAPRATRAEAFTPITWWKDREGPIAPIEALVILVAEELSRVADDRTEHVEVARRLKAALDMWAGGNPVRTLRGRRDRAAIRGA